MSEERVEQTEKKAEEGDLDEDKVMTLPEEAVTTTNGDDKHNQSENSHTSSDDKTSSDASDSTTDVQGQNGGASDTETAQARASSSPRQAKDKQDQDLAADEQRLREEPRDREVEAMPIDDEVIDLEIVSSSPAVQPATKSARGKRKSSGRQAGPFKVDPKWLLPFDQGWRRELVQRNMPDGEKQEPTSGRPSDVYYFTPEGTKLRSLVQVNDYLIATKSELTTGNFSFSRYSIHKPPYDLIRMAGRHGRSSTGGSRTPRGKGAGKTPSPPGRGRPAGTTSSPSRGRGRGRGKGGRGGTAIPVKPRITMTPQTEVKDPDRALNPQTIVAALNAPVQPQKKVTIKKVKKPSPAQSPLSYIVLQPAKTQESATSASGALMLAASQSLTPISMVTSVCSTPSPVSQAPAPAVPQVVKKGPVARKRTAPRPSSRQVQGQSFQMAQVHTSMDGTCMESTFNNNRMAMSPPNKRARTSSEDTSVEIEAASALCGLVCPGQEGIPPGLMCSMCMMLFHATCANFVENPNNPLQTFMCKTCRPEGSTSGSSNHSSQGSLPPPPPLSLAPMKSTSELSTSTLTPGIAHYTTSSSTNQVPSAITLAMPGMIPVNSLMMQQSTATMTSSTPTSSLHFLQVGQHQIPPAMGSIQVAPQSLSLPLQPLQQLPKQVVPGGPPPNIQTVDLTKMANQNQVSGQLLTLPHSVLTRLDMTQPLALKVNNKVLMIPSNCFISSASGVKVFLPPGTLPNKLFQEPSKAVNFNFQSKDAQQTLNFNAALSAETVPETIKTVVSELPSSSGVSSTTTRMSRRQYKGINPGECHFQKLHCGYDCMIAIFKYLHVADLLRSIRVCRTWKTVGTETCLWKNILLRNSRVSNWEEAAKYFKKYNTQTLDLRGMRYFEDRNRTWHQFTAALDNLTSICNIHFGQSPAITLHAVAEKLTNLEVLTAESITDNLPGSHMMTTPTKLDIGKFSNLKQLSQLKLRGVCGLILPAFSFSGGLSELATLASLKTLVLTTLRDVPDTEFTFLNGLVELENLELGDCIKWTAETFQGLGNLTKLKSLRLECGGEIPDPALAHALKKLAELETLELVKFFVADNLGEALKELKTLKTVSIWPDNSLQAAQVNTNTLNAIKELTFLQNLDWGIMGDNSTVFVSEQGKVTGNNKEDSSSGNSSHPNVECIPFVAVEAAGGAEAEGGGNVDLLPEYVSIAKLLDQLCAALPSTKIRVFKVPMVAGSWTGIAL